VAAAQRHHQIAAIDQLNLEQMLSAVLQDEIIVDDLHPIVLGETKRSARLQALKSNSRLFAPRKGYGYEVDRDFVRRRSSL
jgi:hypothetical protein